MRRPVRLAAGMLAAVLASNIVAAGCGEDDPGDAFRDWYENARYELIDLQGAWEWAAREHFKPQWDAPPEIDPVAGGGATDPREAGSDAVDPKELDLTSGARVQTDDTGGIWVLTHGTVVHIDDEQVEDIYDIGDGTGSAFTLSVSPDERLTIANRSSIAAYEAGEDEPSYIRDRSVPIRTYAISYQADGTLLSGGPHDPLVAVDSNGRNRPLLDLPEGSDTVLDTVAFVTVLRDSRIVLASWERTGMALWVAVDRKIRPIEEGAGQSRPKESFTSLAPAPDGRLLVTTSDRIEAVDVDTGERETLVDLDGAAGTPSAAASGDDLVFLADGRLWRLPGAFA